MMASDFSIKTGFAGTADGCDRDIFPVSGGKILVVQEILFKAAGSM